MAHFSFGGNMKNNKNYILELILIFIVTILFNLFINGLTNDEVWNYGFAYNISNGLIPYKDFNMIITPLFPLIMSIFGRNIVVYHILNGFICVGIFYYMKKNNPRSYYVTYAILLFFALPNYSLACLLLLYIILDLENRKANDYLIDGEFIKDLKDLTLGYAGSSNQRIIDIKATRNSQELKIIDSFKKI